MPGLMEGKRGGEGDVGGRKGTDREGESGTNERAGEGKGASRYCSKCHSENLCEETLVSGVGEIDFVEEVWMARIIIIVTPEHVVSYQGYMTWHSVQEQEASILPFRTLLSAKIKAHSGVFRS